jgi:hypothetical protein
MQRGAAADEGQTGTEIQDRMLTAEFERMLQAILPSASRTSLTLTEIPEQEGDLARLLDRAIVYGDWQRTDLTEIHVPMDQFPEMGPSFRHVPVEDSGRADVMRLVFEPRDADAGPPLTFLQRPAVAGRPTTSRVSSRAGL